MPFDYCKRAHSISPNLISYIEKHRVYELLYEIATQLIIQKPKDHVLFTRNLLDDFNQTRDKPRILLLAPPHINGLALAEFIQKETGARIIDYSHLTEEEDVSPEIITDKFKSLMKASDIMKTGWILHGFPKTYNEARTLQKNGIYPTHVFEICVTGKKSSLDSSWHHDMTDCSDEELKRKITVYSRNVFELTRAFQSSWKKVIVDGRSLEDVGRECIQQTREPIMRGAPMVGRVVFIGTRGSGRRTIAKRLKEKYNMVHVDLDELMLQVSRTHTETGEILRRLKKRQVPVYNKLMFSILQRRLLENDCVGRGWVLTGFPRVVTDLKALDNSQAPPNKVIFLSIDRSRAFEKLKNRKVNCYTGKVMDVRSIKADPSEDIKEYLTHPRDYRQNVIEEQEHFEKNIEEFLAYCGDNCNIVNADCSEDDLFFSVAKVVLQPCPIAPTRYTKEEETNNKTCWSNFILPTKPCSSIYPPVLQEQTPSQDITLK